MDKQTKQLSIQNTARQSCLSAMSLNLVLFHLAVRMLVHLKSGK
ncbi:MAG: hypothetical protein WA110_07980 [Anaerolineaceae bacterium]